MPRRKLPTQQHHLRPPPLHPNMEQWFHLVSLSAELISRYLHCPRIWQCFTLPFNEKRVGSNSIGLFAFYSTAGSLPSVWATTFLDTKYLHQLSCSNYSFNAHSLIVLSLTSSRQVQTVNSSRSSPQVSNHNIPWGAYGKKWHFRYHLYRMYKWTVCTFLFSRWGVDQSATV